MCLGPIYGSYIATSAGWYVSLNQTLMETGRLI
jgi:hypothetical protein